MNEFKVYHLENEDVSSLSVKTESGEKVKNNIVKYL